MARTNLLSTASRPPAEQRLETEDSSSMLGASVGVFNCKSYPALGHSLVGYRGSPVHGGARISWWRC